MHSRWTGVLTLALLILAAPMAVQAQTSRVEGMAIQGDYIKDYTGIFQYTSQVANVGSLVYGELGVSDGGAPLDRSVGAVVGNLFEGRLGTWAVHMRQFTPQLGQGDATAQPAPGDFGADPNFNPSEQFDLMWGTKFGTTSLGLRLHRSFGQIESDFDLDGTGVGNVEMGYPPGYVDFLDPLFPLDPNFSRNVLGFGAGLGFEMSPTMNVEANVFWQTRTYEISDTSGTTLLEDDGASTYQLAARAWMQVQPNLMIVPVAKWYSFDLSTATTGAVPATAENTLRGWQLGLAGNWSVGTNDLFVLGATVAQNRAEVEQDITTFGIDNGEITETLMPQLFAALETHVNSWLTLRFGANKGAWHTIEVEDNDPVAPGTTTFRDSPFSMALGAGVKIGGLQLDAIINDIFPHNGLYFLSGNTTSPVFPKVTATYAF